MSEGTNKFTHVAVQKPTQRMIAILAKAQDTNIYDLVAYWAQEDWKRALKTGLVTAAMLEQNSNTKKSTVTS